MTFSLSFQDFHLPQLLPVSELHIPSYKINLGEFQSRKTQTESFFSFFLLFLLLLSIKLKLSI